MIEAVIDKWHQHLRGELPGGLDELLDDDVVFFSPIVYTPQEGKAITKLYLRPPVRPCRATRAPTRPAAAAAGGGFRYTKQVMAGDTAVLEFETTRRGQVRQRRRHHPLQRRGPHRRVPGHDPTAAGHQPRARADAGDARDDAVLGRRPRLIDQAAAPPAGWSNTTVTVS